MPEPNLYLYLSTAVPPTPIITLAAMLEPVGAPEITAVGAAVESTKPRVFVS
ncbi:hypothetical protein D3C87_1137210 [compost metagenome]